ncbi:MAG TPA: response regulator [Caldilineae bacterium]|nr:response regulator [Caldilineae bacterium]
MNKAGDAHRRGELPEAFIEQVKRALEHLYDFPLLQRHPLARDLAPSVERAGETAGQFLRRELINAIETLNPGPSVPFRAPHARLYNLLHLHYVEGMTIQEAAHELGVSLRQAYRDLRRGEESVAAVLWARHFQNVHEEPRAIDLSSLQAEMGRLEPHPRPVDARYLLQRAYKAVERLAQQRATRLQIHAPTEQVVISADPTVAQQILTGLLSYVVQQARGGTVEGVLTAGDERATFMLSYMSAPGPASAELPAVVTQLIEKQGWKLEEHRHPDGARSMALHMSAYGPTVLVIDDNEGLVELLDRYLTGHACRVVAAASGREGLELAQEIRPDAIVLDVMMPEVDGWEVLQTLRTRPQTSAIPVIVCSVFNDPELAYSLGASLFLPKPVRRDDVLNALRELGVV